MKKSDLLSLRCAPSGYGDHISFEICVLFSPVFCSIHRMMKRIVISGLNTHTQREKDRYRVRARARERSETYQ